jgi:hypothetical protein
MGKSKRLRQKKASLRQDQVVEKPLFSKTKILCAGLGVLCLAGLPIYFGQNSRPTPDITPHAITQFQPRVPNVDSMRSAFLQDILGDAEMPYCAGVIYDRTGGKMAQFFDSFLLEQDPSISANERFQIVESNTRPFKGGDFIAKTPEVLDFSGRGIYTPIFVGRKLFDDPKYQHFTKEDIRDIIISHEGRHCEQIALGFKDVVLLEVLVNVRNRSLPFSLLYDASELDALVVELNSLGEGNSQAYIDQTKSKYVKIRTNFEQSVPIARGFTAEFIDAALEGRLYN